MVKTINLIQGSYTEQLFKFFLERKAATTKEIISSDIGVKKQNINSYLRELLRKGLIRKSSRRVQSKVRKCSSEFVYGLSELDIEQKINQLETGINRTEFLIGLKKHIKDFLEATGKGYTTAEIMFYLRTLKGYENYENWDYLGTIIREMVLEGQGERNGRSCFEKHRTLYAE